MAHVRGAPAETINWVGLQNGTSWFQKCIQLYTLMLSHPHNTLGQWICSFRIPKTCIDHWRHYLFVLMASVWNDNIQFFRLRCGQIWNFRRIPAGTLSHLTYVGMSIRDSKNYPKSIVKYQSEDRKVSEGAMISFQNGNKVRKNVCCIWIWVTQICLLSSPYYFHVSILYSHV